MQYRYLKSTPNETYLAIPAGWGVLDEAQINAGQATTPQFPYEEYFEAKAKPDFGDIIYSSSSPWGMVRVRTLGPDDQVAYSFENLNNEILPFDLLSQLSDLRVMGNATLLLHGTYRGIRQVVEYTDPKNHPVEVEESGYVNNATTKSWALVIGCSPSCFQQNSALIHRTVQNWVVGQ